MFLRDRGTKSAYLQTPSKYRVREELFFTDVASGRGSLSNNPSLRRDTTSYPTRDCQQLRPRTSGWP